MQGLEEGRTKAGGGGGGGALARKQQSVVGRRPSPLAHARARSSTHAAPLPPSSAVVVRIISISGRFVAPPARFLKIGRLVKCEVMGYGYQVMDLSVIALWNNIVN